MPTNYLTEEEKKKNNTFDNETAQTYYNANENIDNYYQQLADQEYEKLLDADIELAGARDRAMKYANNVMANQGYATSGYGSSNAIAMQNAYMNAMNDNQRDYNVANRELNLAKAEEYRIANENKFQNDLAMITSSESEEELYDYAQKVGLGSYNENGDFTLTKPSDMSEDDFAQLQRYYDSALSNLQEAKWEEEHKTRVSLDNIEKGIENIVYTNKKGNVKNFDKDNFKGATKIIGHDIQNGNLRNGDYVSIVGKKGERLCFVLRNGELVRVSKATYEKANANNKHSYSYSKSGTNGIKKDN